jgi:hypothetical protein
MTNYKPDFQPSNEEVTTSFDTLTEYADNARIEALQAGNKPQHEMWLFIRDLAKTAANDDSGRPRTHKASAIWGACRAAIACGAVEFHNADLVHAAEDVKVEASNACALSTRYREIELTREGRRVEAQYQSPPSKARKDYLATNAVAALDLMKRDIQPEKPLLQQMLDEGYDTSEILEIIVREYAPFATQPEPTSTELEFLDSFLMGYLSNLPS